MKNFTQKLCLTLTLALLLFTSTCFAKITKDDFCIGGGLHWAAYIRSYC